MTQTLATVQEIDVSDQRVRSFDQEAICGSMI
jgi:hypothetical protein